MRARILKGHVERATQAAGLGRWEEAAAVFERVLAAERNLYPNLDWPAGRLYHALGLEVSLDTPLFVTARVAGWCAHAMEQMEHNRLIRPRSRYIGPRSDRCARWRSETDGPICGLILQGVLAR